ncbi:heavy metal translocating P-type ATPase [Nanchangia anserum]|uniref:Heavy metal translocating P-type ATPase n=1 Tax=Nanchangia anserum TaxID=2692125 RepID=A0A8I0KUE8_9ACTO|nr:heavy metal translocating P-type ATPase [Nanchangia anserum]MBD3689618.1 heavy metal translocating P-type ATPase [Nanchangia anserum]QOX81800.1 heavy metal translocating P-type ATPase [Nanchangia anserum]
MTSSSPTAAPIDSQARRARMLAHRLIVACVCSLPVMVISMVPGAQFPGWQWVCAALALPVVTWCAAPFYASAWQAGRHGSTTMNTLISLGIIASIAWSYYALFFTEAGAIGVMAPMEFLPRSGSAAPHVYFEGATMIATFLLLGRWLEARSRHRAGDALRSLLSLGAKRATVVQVDDNGAMSEHEVPVEDLVEGDLVRVRPGEKIPTDGRIEQGTSAIDTSLVTGESLPREVGPSDPVIGATLNTSGALLVRVTAVGRDTMLAHIARMVADAQAGKAPIQRLADRVSAVFVPVILALALATFIGWLVMGASVSQAITVAVSVLVIACPCALGLATPTALLVGSGRAAQLGVVFRGPEILEGAHRIDTMVLDKTGTLTTGVMEVDAVHPLGESSRGPRGLTPAGTRLLRLAGAAEASSEHPLARAVVRAAVADGDTPLPAGTRFGNHAGMGIHAVVGDELVLVGQTRWLSELGLDVPTELRNAERQAAISGASVVAVALGHEMPTEHDAAEETGGDKEPEPTATSLDFAIEGMTCAACVSRVERALNSVDGVDATVNLATESARANVPIDHPRAGDLESLSADLIEAVTASGYTAKPQTSDEVTHRRHRDDTLRPLVGGEVLGLIIVRDRVRETSVEAIRDLRTLGITPHLATGDNAGAAGAVAARVGIESVDAEVTPGDKRDIVARLQREGATVAMVGDGVNDAAALAQAGQRGLGMAMGQGTDAAIAAADVTLIRSDIRSAVTAIRVGRRTLAIIKENLAWAFGYNIIAVPLAIAGLANPMLAAAFMASSSVLVVANSLRLRRAG